MKFVRRFRLAPILTLGLLTASVVGPFASASGQTGAPDTTQNPFDYPRGRSTTGESGSESSRNGASEAVNQVQAANESYRPDQIQSSDSRSRNDEDDRIDRTSTRSRVDPDNPTASRSALRPAPPSEFEIFVAQVADKPLRRFGANLLVPTSRDFTAPPLTTVPGEYRINAGDELVVGLTGTVESDSLRLRVDQDGRIFLPRVGAITVAGVRYGDVQSVISAQVSRQYRNFRVSVTMGALRGLTVYVTGFAQTPGSYTVSSLSTLVNAVLAAGGPAAGGSFRSIQLRRGGKLISDFDLYDLLLKGDKSADAMLQNGDVIYIAPAGAQVAVIGAVNSESIYEARPGETLTDVLLYAGGVSTVADDTRLLVLDPLDSTGGWQQITPVQARGQIARRAAVLRVLSGLGIARPLGGQAVLVTVNGEVAKPGRYYVRPGTSVSDVVAQAGGLTPDAYTYGTVFTRDSLRTQQRQSYERALRDTQFLLTATPLTSVMQADGNQLARLQALQSTVRQLEQRRPDGRLVLDLDYAAPVLPGELVLENNDAIYVPPRPITVGVFGSVPSPASFRFATQRTIGQYLAQAGGVQKIGDSGSIFVVRANGTVLASRRGLFKGSILNQRALPGDLIYVPINPSRGEFWARLRDLTQTLFTGAVATASVAAVIE